METQDQYEKRDMDMPREGDTSQQGGFGQGGMGQPGESQGGTGQPQQPGQGQGGRGEGSAGSEMGQGQERWGQHSESGTEGGTGTGAEDEPTGMG